MVNLLRLVDDPRSRAEVIAEKEVVRRVEAGCKAPIGVLFRFVDDGVVEARIATTTPEVDRLILVRRRARIDSSRDMDRLIDSLVSEFHRLGGPEALDGWRRVVSRL
jgi:porphobilinogen deaminase